MKIQAFAPHVSRARVVSWLERRARDGLDDGTEEGAKYRDRCRALYRGDGTVLVLTRSALGVAQADQLGLPRHNLHLEVHFRRRGTRQREDGKRVLGWWPVDFRGRHAISWAERILGDDLERAVFTMIAGDDDSPATAHWRVFTDPAWEPVATETLPGEALEELGYHFWTAAGEESPAERLSTT